MNLGKLGRMLDKHAIFFAAAMFCSLGSIADADAKEPFEASDGLAPEATALLWAN